MSTWWLVPLGLGSVGAVVARLAAGRLRREDEALVVAAAAVRAVTETIATTGSPPRPG